MRNSPESPRPLARGARKARLAGFLAFTLLGVWLPLTGATPAAAASANVASQASVTQSSQNTSTQQTALKAVDGLPLGYPTDYTKEWATVGGKAGSWLQLGWSSPITVDKVVLYDRPNTDDQITAANLVFSDGTKLATGSLNNNGAATTVTIPAQTTTSVRLEITGVSTTTWNVGLAEIEVWAGSAENRSPQAQAGANFIAPLGSTVTLDGSASTDPDNEDRKSVV